METLSPTRILKSRTRIFVAIIPGGQSLQVRELERAQPLTEQIRDKPSLLCFYLSIHDAGENKSVGVVLQVVKERVGFLVPSETDGLERPCEQSLTSTHQQIANR